MPSYKLKNNVIRDPKGRVKYKKFTPEGHEHYHIGLWVEADSEQELDQIQYVEYELHPSFQNRIRKSENRKNDFSITFWSWGTFKVSAKLHMIGRQEPILISHDLKYELPQDTLENYVDVS